MKKITFDRACEILFYIIGIIAIIAIFASTQCTKTETPKRDFSYEAYCDSIWENDKNYWYDVLIETDTFQQYIDSNGQWWEDDCPAVINLKELLSAKESCILRAEYLLSINNIQDTEYNEYKQIADSLCIKYL